MFSTSLWTKIVDFSVILTEIKISTILSQKILDYRFLVKPAGKNR